MTHSFVTYGLPFAAEHSAAVEARLAVRGRELFGRTALRDRLRRQALHFMSVTVVPGDAGKPCHLIVEMSVDGTDAAAEHIAGTLLADEIEAILDAAGIAHGGGVVEVLRRHRIRTGTGLFDTPGLDFCGTPGMTVGRIRDEFVLARNLRNLMDTGTMPRGTALARLTWARDALLGAGMPPDLHHLREAEPVPALPAASGFAPGLTGVAGVAFSAAWVLLWPVLAGVAVLVALATLMAARHGITLAFTVLVASALIGVLLIAGVAAWLYARLRALERANQPDDSLPDPDILDAVVAGEGGTMQNHLAGTSVMQPGWLRPLTLRLAFAVIGLMAQRHFRPGFLGDIGTIHFARWVRLPGTDRLLFLSNYGGSWESYLEDFITKASAGLTGVWSNTIGFPQTENLFQKGATDGDRFKRWARRQQRATLFWYSAYPHLSTARIRTNAAIRHGLVTASTEDEAEAWFGLIGSVGRPAEVIETDEVQSIFFGGLKRQPEAASLICALPETTAAARAWLGGIKARITFGEGLPRGTVHVLGLSAGALHRLGLPDETLAQFPLAFRQGMAHSVRTDILKDTGNDKPAKWLWGGQPGTDAVVNIYAEDGAALDAAIASLGESLTALGGRILFQVRMEGLPAPGTPMREPFGFVDGVSQPVVRGTRRWTRDADAIHACEPGEFLYGYPDNRGTTPLSPRLRASADPGNLLAVIDPRHSRGLLLPNFAVTGANADRDFGRNGSFLVVRQLEQDVPRFNAFLDRAAADIEGRPGVPQGLSPSQRAEWVGAKMVGRWKDGTSLVRHPNAPGTGWNGEGAARPDNDFLLGAEGPSGNRCPFGSHIRRTNPRESVAPGSMEQLSIVNRHRILRRGRTLTAGGSGDREATHPGLYFMCLNIDIERQFEFIQQTWVMALQFHGLENEVDAILSRGGISARLTVPTAAGPLTIHRKDSGAADDMDFVKVRGGGYFFMPGRRSLDFLTQ